MEPYINKDICGKCVDSCCKRTGCIYLPEDFESMEYEYLLNLILEGNISIVVSVFYVHPTIELLEKYNISDLSTEFWSYYLYLKVRNIDSDIIDFLNKRSSCSMLTDSGCFYSDDKRPSLGLSLIPKKPNGPCFQSARKYNSEIDYDWIKYQDVLNRIVFTISGETTSQLFEDICLSSEEYVYLNNSQLCYIDCFEGIKAKCNYCKKEIDENINVKKLILEQNKNLS